MFSLVGGGQGGLNLPLPVPLNPGSRPVFFGSRPFAFIRLRNITQCYVIFPFFSRFPLPWESRFPPPLLPPPVHLPPPFLPVSRPPVPPHSLLRAVSETARTSICETSLVKKYDKRNKDSLNKTHEDPWDPQIRNSERRLPGVGKEGST